MRNVMGDLEVRIRHGQAFEEAEMDEFVRKCLEGAISDDFSFF